MIKIDPQERVLNMDGTDGGFTMGTAIGSCCMNAPAGGKMKMADIGFRFAREKAPIELNDSEFNLIYSTVERSGAYEGNLVIGQVLRFLSNCRDDSSVKSPLSPKGDTEEIPPAPRGNKKK